jgi:regulator of cell morphogenesis and NO signaling
MTLTQERTVGEIAREEPRTVRVFEKFGIDFCCGGKRPLEDVCREQGVPLDEIRAALETAAAGRDTGGTDWNKASLEDLIGHIVVRHHAYLNEALPRISARIEKVASKHAEDYGNSIHSIAEVFEGLRAELGSHMMKEERILFPAILEYEVAAGNRQLPSRPMFGSVNHPIAMMEHEHEGAGRALEALRNLTGGYVPPPEACNTYRALYAELEEMEGDLHIHIHLENNILHPRAAALEARLFA